MSNLDLYVIFKFCLVLWEDYFGGISIVLACDAKHIDDLAEVFIDKWEKDEQTSDKMKKPTSDKMKKPTFGRRQEHQH